MYFFEKTPGIFHVFTLPLEISDKTELNSWIFHKIVLDPLEIPRPKTKTSGNPACCFFDTPGKSISSTPHVWIFSGLTHYYYYYYYYYYY